MKYRKLPVIIEATQWFKNGDHPQDNSFRPLGDTGQAPMIREGEVVRYYRHPVFNGKFKCPHCGDIMHNHGWIDTLEGGHIVCPGDWIITGIKGEYYPCKPDIFALTYEKVEKKKRKPTKEEVKDRIKKMKAIIRSAWSA